MKQKLILGTVQFGLDYGINNTEGKPSDATVTEILDATYANGIQMLDTAEAYGNSQERIGEYHRNSSNQFKVITKYSSMVKNLPLDISERIKNNLNILNIPNLYCYMFHSFAEYQKYYTNFQYELRQLKREGKIEKIGVSIYTNEEMEKVLENEDISLIQLPFNLLDNKNQRGKLIEKAKRKGVEVHTRSVFLQGLFFQSKGDILKPYLEKLNLISQGFSMNELALSYSVNQTFIDKVLVGVDNTEQLYQNIKGVNTKIPQIIIDEIDEIEVKEKEMLNPSNWKK